MCAPGARPPGDEHAVPDSIFRQFTDVRSPIVGEPYIPEAPSGSPPRPDAGILKPAWVAPAPGHGTSLTRSAIAARLLLVLRLCRLRLDFGHWAPGRSGPRGVGPARAPVSVSCRPRATWDAPPDARGPSSWTRSCPRSLPRPSTSSSRRRPPHATCTSPHLPPCGS